MTASPRSFKSAAFSFKARVGDSCTASASWLMGDFIFKLLGRSSFYPAWRQEGDFPGSGPRRSLKTLKILRCGWESNPRIRVLQTLALPLGHRTVYQYLTKLKEKRHPQRA